MREKTIGRQAVWKALEMSRLGENTDMGIWGLEEPGGQSHLFSQQELLGHGHVKQAV